RSLWHGRDSRWVRRASLGIGLAQRVRSRPWGRLMDLAERLAGLNRVFLDTAPVIYFVEGKELAPHVSPIFSRLQSGSMSAATSPVTLTECLVLPMKNRSALLDRKFTDIIVRGKGVTFTTIDEDISRRAAEIRARHSLRLMDAYQLA